MDTNSQESEIQPTENETGVEPVAEETSSPDVTEGVSSSDTSVEDQEDTADAIREAFLKEYGDPAEDEAEEPAETKKEGEQTSPETERKEAPEAENAEKDDGDGEFRISDEEFKALPDGARKRIGHLNARAKKAERQIGEVQQKLQVSEQAVERVNQLESFVTENNIEPDNMARAFAMTAKLAQGDFEGFLSDVQPFVDHARQSLGQAVPADLQRQVDEGHMTQEAAQELVKARMQQQRIEGENQKLRRQTDSFQQQQAQQQTVTSIAQAVDAREHEIKASDPDYAHIAEAVKRNVEFLFSNGARPQSPEDAIKMVNQAYELAKQSSPKPTPEPTIPRPSASTVARGTPKAATLEDAIYGAIGG